MYALDFEYDGQHLSDFGFIICDFSYASGATTATAGSQLEFHKVSRNRGKTFGLTGTKYYECISTSFDICKDPRIHDDLVITDDECRDLVRWLNRGEFLKFQIVKEEKFEGDYCWYEASFNIEKIKIREKLCGLTLKMETNAPFGYGEKVYVYFDNRKESDVFSIYDLSDEIGYIYPDIVISCKVDGDVILSNSLTGCSTTIANCSVGEVITIHGDTQILTSSNPDHKIGNDFNYDFFSIGNTYGNTLNTITVSPQCIAEFWYVPIVKATP